MTTKYNIGNLNKSTLTTKGFVASGDNMTLKTCINDAISSTDGKNKFVAIKPLSPPEGTGILMKGTCLRGGDSNYNPITDPDSTTFDANNPLYEIYAVPNSICLNDNDCLVNNANKFLSDEKDNIKALIVSNQNELTDASIRLFAINNQLTLADAITQYNLIEQKKKIMEQTKILNLKKSLLQSHLAEITNANTNSKMLLSDKNKLLATVNSNIQQKYTKLEQINNDINTVTQDIYVNNADSERKENIISTLKIIISIVVLMVVIMIIYIGMQFTEKNYPNAYNTFNNGLNKLGFQGYGNNIFI